MSGRRNSYDPLDNAKMPISARFRAFLAHAGRRMRFAIGKRLPPRETAVDTLYKGGNVPVCPRCGDVVYYSDMCINCGQRFKAGAKTIGEVMEHEC